MKLKIIGGVLGALLIAAVIGGYFFPLQQAEETAEAEVAAEEEKSFKILHVMSYHTPWEWTEDQLRGFQEPLRDLDVTYQVYEMDTKNRSSEEWKIQSGVEAKAIIDSWKPDLVYTNDDNAQKYLVQDYVNDEIPFVFSAVNNDPSVYGFTGSSNVTGVLEKPHFVETIKLLKDVAPEVKKIAIIIDDDPTWTGVAADMKAELALLPSDVEIVSFDTISNFDDYKRKIAEYQGTVDALGLLGIHTYKDENGENIPWQEVLEWTAKNSSLPDFSFYEDRVQYGTLVAMGVSGYEQGIAAGKIAYDILAEGKSPSSFKVVPTIKGKPIVSLARANDLGIQFNTNILSTATVVSEYQWEK